MKISFVSTARYPTEKAYGVTIGESCAAARRLGHTANIVTIGLSGVDSLGNQIIGIESRQLRRLRSIIQGKKSSYFTRIAFALSSIFLARKFKSTFINDSAGILWARDIFLVFALKAMNYRGMILLEIHHLPNWFNGMLLKNISKREKVMVTTLTPTHKKILELRIEGLGVVICPMAVPENFFLDASEKPSSEVLIMGYIGKATSSGHDNGLKQLILMIKSLSETNLNFVFQFVGLETSAVTDFRQEMERLHINERYIEFIENVGHGDVLKYLRNIEIGFVPYPDSVYNGGRFPIKIPEYAATRCAIFASDTSAHREILSDSIATFYSTTDKFSAIREILKFTEDRSEFLEKVSNASKWAIDFTYERRVKDVLHAWVGKNSLLS